MRDGPQLAEKMFQALITEQERIAPAEQNVADLFMPPDVIDLLGKVRMKVVSACVADQTRAGAIAAVSSAPVGHQKQNAVWIPVHQPWHRRMRIFTTRVGH